MRTLKQELGAFGGIHDSIYPSMTLPLLKTLNATPYGVAQAAFSRSTAATVIDFEGIIHTALIDEIRFTGARRVRNLLSNSAVLSTQTVTVVPGNYYVLSFRGSGSVTLSGAATGTLIGSTGRVQVTKVASSTSLTLTVSGSVLQAQLEKVVGTQTVASEYVSVGELSWPYHGAGVDGVKYFTTDRDGASLDVNGALIEPSATNLITYSNTFTSWTVSSVGVTASQVDSALGALQGSKIVCTGTGSGGLLITGSATSGVTYVQSVDVKPGNTNFVSLTFGSTFNSNYGYAVFNLLTCTVDTVSNCTASITKSYDGFCRCSIANTATSTSTHAIAFITPSVSGASRLATVTGNYVYVSAAQTEAVPQTSYIPTSGTTVTRTADLPVYNVADVITQGQGSLYCEAVFKGLLSSTTYLLSMDDATSSNIISLYISSGTTLYAVMTADGTTGVLSSIGSVSKDTLYKILITYQYNEFKVYINGSLVFTDTSCTVPTSLNALRFAKYNGSDLTAIQIKNLQYFHEVIPSTESIRMTS